MLVASQTPKESKGSLGAGERANLTVQAQIRCLRLATAKKYKMDIDPNHFLIAWVVRHGCWIHNNFQVKENGKTPYQSCRGKPYGGQTLEFGEVCLYRDLSEDDKKLNPRWKKGVFVGKVDITDEFLVLTQQG